MFFMLQANFFPAATARAIDAAKFRAGHPTAEVGGAAVARTLVYVKTSVGAPCVPT